MKQVFQRLKKQYQQWQTRRQIQWITGQVLSGEDPVKIMDGVDYSLPIYLPQSLRESLTRTDRLDGYLKESFAKAVQFQFDSPYKDDLPFSPVTEDPLREWNWSTRKRVLESTHAAYNRNPDAKLGVNLLANFTVGDGFQLTCHHPQVGELLEAFIDNPDNRIREYERQAARDIHVDGELILRLQSEKGETVAVPLRPWELESIKTESGMFRRVEHYNFQFYNTEGDDPTGNTETDRTTVPADDILFVAINNHAYELRGRPTLYPILPWLKARKDWLENRARINYWLSVISWIINVQAQSQAHLSSVYSRWATPPKPGTVAIESDKVTVQPVHAQIGASDAADDGRQLMLMIVKGFGLAEYFYADGENANLASATKQELPALTVFSDMQRTLIQELWKPLFKRVIQAAVDANVLPMTVKKHDANGDEIPDEDPIPTVDAFDVAYEELTGTDLAALSTAIGNYLNNNVIDLQTAREMAGHNHEVIEKRLDQQREKMMQDMAQGKLPPMPMMRDKGLPPDNPPDEDEEDEEKPEPEAA